MKVLLINPPAEHEIIANDPALIGPGQTGHAPPLGLLYVAAYMLEHSEHQVEVLDAQAEGIGHEGLRGRIVGAGPQVVGITAMTLTVLDVIQTCRAVEAACPEAAVVVGGPHATLFPRETAGLDGVDYVVTGEGERPFTELVNCLGRGRPPRDVAGVVFATDDGFVQTEASQPVDDLDSLPFPARHLTPLAAYGSVLAKRHPVTTLMTSRGCPYQCTYCYRPTMGRRLRCRSAANVVDEMEHCVRMGIHEFLIYDDTFTVRRDRVRSICREIRSRGLEVGWDVRARVDTVDPELLQDMAAAGCERIHYGVESGQARVRELLGKSISDAQVQDAFRWAKDAGLRTLAYFMLGCPTETRDDALRTIEVARALDPDYVQFTILCPFPGTALYREALDTGLYESDLWQCFAARPTADFEPPYWTERLTADELRELAVRAYRRFYLRPGYVLKRLGSIRSPGELWRQIKAGLRVARLKTFDGP